VVSNLGGFKSSSIFPIVVLAAATGARRNEILAFRWTDLGTEKKTLWIERAWEPTKYGPRLKPPKTARGLRTINLDDSTIFSLVKERETHQRLSAGIPAGSDVDLSLIRLPAGGLLMFPNPPEPGRDSSFTVPRIPRSVSQAFARLAEALGFGRTRFHDLRGIHSTALLDARIPPHTDAQRIGDDPATLLRNYTKRKRSKKADQNLSDAIAGPATGFMRP
jgi:integrase